MVKVKLNQKSLRQFVIIDGKHVVKKDEWVELYSLSRDASYYIRQCELDVVETVADIDTTQTVAEEKVEDKPVKSKKTKNDKTKFKIEE